MTPLEFIDYLCRHYKYQDHNKLIASIETSLSKFQYLMEIEVDTTSLADKVVVFNIKDLPSPAICELVDSGLIDWCVMLIGRCTLAIASDCQCLNKDHLAVINEFNLGSKR
jgi:hypothetical protein